MLYKSFLIQELSSAEGGTLDQQLEPPLWHSLPVTAQCERESLDAMSCQSSSAWLDHSCHNHTVWGATSPDLLPP